MLFTLFNDWMFSSHLYARRTRKEKQKAFPMCLKDQGFTFHLWKSIVIGIYGEKNIYLENY